MSSLLESRLTQEQREACAVNDELLERELIRFELARNVNKGERLAKVNDDHARDLQIQFQGYIGGLPA